MRIRLRRPADSATVVLRREVVTDPRLTLTAVGVLAWVTALPEDRPVTVAEVLHRAGEDPGVAQAALDALEAAGYLQVDPDVGADGEAYLSDRPAPPLPAPAVMAGTPGQQTDGGDTGPTPQVPAAALPVVEPDLPMAVDDEAARASALGRIRHILTSARSERERQQAQAEAALRARLAVAADARRQAAADRAARKAAEDERAAQAAAEVATPAEPAQSATGDPDTSGGKAPTPGSS